MKKEILIAKHKGEECGRKEINMPETIYEAVELVGEERALELFTDGYKISERASLYPTPEGKPSKMTQMKADIYAKLVQNGVPAAKASEITGYEPPKAA